MNFSLFYRSHPRVFVMVAACALALLAVPKAQAFTIDDKSNTNADGSAKFSDPDSRFSSSGSNGNTVYRNGPMSLQFGTQRPGSDRNYNPERLFNPNGRPGEDR